jgi:hypothetical protein
MFNHIQAHLLATMVAKPASIVGDGNPYNTI